MNKSRLTHLLIIVSFIIFSCNSDDENRPDDSQIANDLEGTWSLVNYELTEIGTKTVNDIEIPYNYTQIGIEYDYLMKITTQPMKIITSGIVKVNEEEVLGEGDDTFITTGSFTFNSNDNQQEGWHTGDWRIENGKLINLFDENPQEADAFEFETEIIELTENKLIFSINLSQDGFISETRNTTGNVTLVYEKN
ncbi:hypothetical protein [uncultured Aquimarina sp.]|uniref:hypothetical protein n=1 Tax=uncultured Aquimarina sp. TaxID=575652 RepID=UPI00262B885E|nr:hypothetical protein [uncultured Aquimarina sp.]